MLKRLVPVLVVTLVIALFCGTLGFLWWKSREPPETFQTETATVVDIIKKTVATGAIVPRNEVEIKPRVSGVVKSIAVEPGQHAAEGDLIARIQIIPDAGSLARAEASVDSARIALDDAKTAARRAEDLYAKQAISVTERDARAVALAQAQASYDAAVTQLRVVREGAARGGGAVSTEVRSTVEGMVLAVDVKVGHSVIESNTFNAGTTIARVADMTDMIFEGWVDESEVGRIREGMPLALSIGAIEGRRFSGTLEYIAPKGELRDGAVQFQIRAALDPVADVFVRAGVSANADIVLDRRDKVLALRESALKFDGDAVYVEVEVGEQQFERRDVKVGLSDGIYIELVDGLAESEPVKSGPGAGPPDGRRGRRFR